MVLEQFQDIVRRYIAKGGSLKVDTFELLCLELVGIFPVNSNEKEVF